MLELMFFGFCIVMFGLFVFNVVNERQEQEQNKKLQKEKEIFYKTCKYPNERKLNDLLFEQSKNFKMTRTSGPTKSSLFDEYIHSNLDYILFANMKNDKIEIVYNEYDYVSYIESINIKTNNSVFLVYDCHDQDYISGPWDDDIDVLIDDGYKNLLKRKIENCLKDIEKEKNDKLEQIAKEIAKEIAKQSVIKDYIIN